MVNGDDRRPHAQGVRPAGLPGGDTRPGLHARGAARARVGLDPGVAGPGHGHRARPAAATEARARPRQPALAAHGAGHRLPLLGCRDTATDRLPGDAPLARGARGARRGLGRPRGRPARAGSVGRGGRSSRPCPPLLAMEMEPPSWLVTRSRTIDSPRLVVWSMSKSLGQTAPVVADLQRELVARRWRARAPRGPPPRPSLFGHEHGSSGPARIREGVLDGVLQQLGQHDGQRRGDIGGHLAHVPGHLDLDAVPRHDRVLRHADQ